MSRELWINGSFWLFGVAAVWFGWRVFRTDSMVRASFSLLASFLCVGVIMLLLLGEYLGVALFFMMGVEMTVMAVFMIAFMMNPAGLNPMQMVHQHRLSITAGFTSFTVLAILGFAIEFPDVPVADAGNSIRALGMELMEGSMMLMESVGVTILATMVGGTVLASKWGRFGTADDGSRPPALDPEAQVPDAQVPTDDVLTQETTGHAHHGGHG